MSWFSRGDFRPAGLGGEQVELIEDTIRVHSRSAKTAAACPQCGTISRQIHSRYRHRPADLPAHGRKVKLVWLVRRFRCRALWCPARIFAERFPPDVTRAHARRTSRLQGVVRHLGLALGGRPIGHGKVAARPQDCPPADHGPESPLQVRCHPGLNDRGRIAGSCHSPSADGPVHGYGAQCS
ncbi:transposase family protein [Paracoccus seriniphilus]|nr:transposase family protein [Paracoccus seriniphilus]